MTTKFPSTLDEVLQQHADTIERLRKILVDRPCIPSLSKRALDVSPSEKGWTTSVLGSRLDLDDSGPDAFLPQLQERLKNSREAATLSR